uniref:Uncharacterized protein n=1 Tax=Cyclocybe aegerita TaxID=1973307 RepID=A0A884P6G4_CYCAE|nr:hypothetical protein K4014_mgp37 [Cyclocybe aegerita]QQP21439.1 hypothetical protein [Cyclocybe aegerita]
MKMKKWNKIKIFYFSISICPSGCKPEGWKQKISRLFPIKNSKIVLNFKSAFIFPFILKIINPENVTNNPEPIVVYAFSMFVLSLIVLLCIINVMGYVLSLYLISKYDIESKYPKLKKILIYFTKSTEITIIIEGIIAINFLLAIIIINFFLFTKLTL